MSLPQQDISRALEISYTESGVRSGVGNDGAVTHLWQAIMKAETVRYYLTLDNQEVETEGISCLIANTATIGQPNLSLAPGIDVSDGLLDVLVMRANDLRSILSAAVSLVTDNENSRSFLHWQARRIDIAVSSPQNVQADGDFLGRTPVRVTILPQAVQVIVPKHTLGADEVTKTESK
jgi:diacylglycerol kinase (ATP)